MEHRGGALGELVALGQPEGDARQHDLALGAHQPLGHRRLGYQVGPGDLAGREAADRTQGQRDLGLRRERRVAAQEDQPQLVVGERRVRRLVGPVRRRRERLVDTEPQARCLDLLGQPQDSRRIRSRARLPATVVSHAPGLSGRPSRGQVSSAARQASWNASSARSRLPNRRMSVPRTRADSVRNRSSATPTTPGNAGDLARHRMSPSGRTSTPENAGVGDLGGDGRARGRGCRTRRRSSRPGAPWSRRTDRRSSTGRRRGRAPSSRSPDPAAGHRRRTRPSRRSAG